MPQIQTFSSPKIIPCNIFIHFHLSSFTSIQKFSFARDSNQFYFGRFSKMTPLVLLLIKTNFVWQAWGNLFNWISVSEIHSHQGVESLPIGCNTTKKVNEISQIFESHKIWEGISCDIFLNLRDFSKLPVKRYVLKVNLFCKMHPFHSKGYIYSSVFWCSESFLWEIVKCNDIM